MSDADAAAPAAPAQEQEQKKPEASDAPKRRKRIAIKRDREEEVKQAEKSAAPAPKRKKAPRRKHGYAEEVKEETKWHDWHSAIYFVGTEWENYHRIEKLWNFDHLAESIKSGEISQAKNAYLFGVTEPQQVDGRVTLVPAIVALIGDFPAPRKVGITSVTMNGESFKTVDDLKMVWQPYYLDNNVSVSKKAREHVTNVQILTCAVRKPQVKKLKVQQAKQYEYAIPYFVKPKELLQVEVPTEVSGIATLGGKRAVNYNYDWTDQKLSEYVTELMEDEGVEEEYKDEITKTIQEHVRKQKEQNDADKAKRKAEYDAIPEALRIALDNAVKLKFYPQNKNPDLGELGLKSTFINRYYKHADKVL